MNVPDSKSGNGLRRSRVRIPPSPPKNKRRLYAGFCFLEEGEDEKPRGFDPKLFEVVYGTNLDRVSEPHRGAHREV